MVGVILITIGFTLMALCDLVLIRPELGIRPRTEDRHRAPLIEDSSLQMTSNLRHWWPIIAILIGYFSFDPIVSKIIEWKVAELPAAICVAGLFAGLLLLPGSLIIDVSKKYLTNAALKQAAVRAEDDQVSTAEDDPIWDEDFWLSVNAMAYLAAGAGLASIVALPMLGGVGLGLVMLHSRHKDRNLYLKKWRHISA